MEQDGPDELIVARSLDDGKTLWKYALKTRWGDFMSGVGPRLHPDPFRRKTLRFVLGRFSSLFGSGFRQTSVENQNSG